MGSLDTEKLGCSDRTGQSRKRDPGWALFHFAIDDASRLGDTALIPDENQSRAVRFLTDALGWFAVHGVVVERVMTDSGSADRRRHFADALQARGLTHKRTRPYTPRTNG